MRISVIAHIGGLHLSTDDKICRHSRLGTDVQLAQAIRFVVDKVNADSTVLPNTTLGLVFLDTCRRPMTAVTRALQVSNTFCVDQSEYEFDPSNIPRTYIHNKSLLVTDIPINKMNMTDINNADQFRLNVTLDSPDSLSIPQSHFDNIYYRPSYRVIGVLGAGKSSMSLVVNPILSAHNIPQVSYGSTVDQLSDKTTFPYFVRTIKANKFQAQALVDVAAYLNWTYIALLTIDDSYGQNSRDQFTKYARKAGLCLAYETQFSSESTEDVFDKIVKDLVKIKELTTIFLYMYSYNMQQVYFALKRANVLKRFVIVTSTSFGQLTYRGHEHIMQGTLSTAFANPSIPEFIDYYSSQSPWASDTGSWFGQYLHKDVDCTTSEPINLTYGVDEDGIVYCSTLKTVTDFPHFLWYHYIPKVMETTMVFPYALHNLIIDKCPEAFGNRSALRNCVDGSTLLKYIYNVTFEGNTQFVQFDENGDVYGSYDITYLEEIKNGVFVNKVVGNWDRKTRVVTLNTRSIKWFVSDSDGSVPESLCAHPCGVGQFYIQGELECCWECRHCRDNEYVREDQQGCETCPEFTWPDQETFINCSSIIPTYMLWMDSISISLECLASFGLIAIIIISTLFIKNRTRRIIRGSGVDLMIPILVGLVFACGSVFAYIAQPTTITCYLNYGGFHISCSLMFGPLFLKTVRMYRIFKAADHCQKGIRFVHRNSQILLTAVLLFLEVCITAILTNTTDSCITVLRGMYNCNTHKYY